MHQASLQQKYLVQDMRTHVIIQSLCGRTSNPVQYLDFGENMDPVRDLIGTAHTKPVQDLTGPAHTKPIRDLTGPVCTGPARDLIGLDWEPGTRFTDAHQRD